MKSKVGDFKRHLSRLFKTTTEDSSNVGKKDHDTSKTWLKWYAKYREPCIKFIALKRPQWKDDAEDIVQRVAAKIVNRDYIRENAFRITAEHIMKANENVRRKKESSEETPAPRDAK